MYLLLIVRTFFLYIFIVISYRIMGKKEVGELGVIDLIVSFLIAELAAISIEEPNKSVLTSIVPILVLVIVQIVLSYISMKNSKLRKLIDGVPSVIINKGKINFNIMRKLRYSLDDLLTQIREKDIKDIEKIKYAVLENNGKLSIFQDNYDYPLPLIVEGRIEEETLRSINKDYVWLNRELKKRSIKLDNVFYAFYANNKTYIITKEDLM